MNEKVSIPSSIIRAIDYSQSKKITGFLQSVGGVTIPGTIERDRITIGADVSLGETKNTPPLSIGKYIDWPSSFKVFYEKNGKKAGLYYFDNDYWIYIR
jgi:hypothetical protein